MEIKRQGSRARPGLQRTGVLLAAGALVLAACAGEANDLEETAEPEQEDETGAAEPPDDWPTDTVTFILPTSPGGGADTTARELQPYIQEQLGVPVAVENREGGSFAVAANVLLQTGDECDAFGLHAEPHIHFSYLTQEVDYTIEDFYPISGIIAELGVIRVRNDSEWETLQDLVDYALENPGELRTGISGSADTNHFGLIDIEEATGAEFNIVPYDGGGPARNALVAGEIDFVHAGIFNSQGIADETKVIAIHQDENKWPELTDDAPTVNEALGIDIPSNQSTYGLFVSRECYEQYPERHQALVDAVRASQQDPDYIDDLEATGTAEKVAFVEPDEYYDDLIETEARVIDILEDLDLLVN